MTHQRWKTLHGCACVLFASLIPVGEGVAQGAMILTAVLCLREPRAAWQGIVGRRATRAMAIAFAVWFAAGLTGLMFGGHGWLKPSELGRWVPLLAVFVIAASGALVGSRWVKYAIVGFVVSLAVASVFALLQYKLDIRPGEWMTRRDVGSGQALVPGEARSVAGGFYYHRLKMGHVLLVGLAAAVGRLAFGRLDWRRWALNAAVASVFAVTMFLTYTRGAVLAAGVAALVCVPFMRGKLRLLAIASLVAVIAVAVALPGVRDRMASSTSEEAAQTRGLVWSQGIRIISDHPLGVGFGNYSALVGRYYDTVRPDFTVRTYPHSMVLAAWAETGPVGAAAYIWFWAAFAVFCGRTLLRKDADATTLAAAGGGLFLLTCLAVVGLTHDLLYHNAVALAFAAGIGAVLALNDHD